MNVHYNIKVTGIVQGVWFRKSTQEQAQILGVTGFVRNEPDGSVYIEAEGPSADVRKLVDWCRKGSDQSQVENVDYSTGEPQGFSSFDIRR